MVRIILTNFLSFPPLGLVILFWVSIFSFFPLSDLGHVMAKALSSSQNLYLVNRNKLVWEAGLLPGPTQPGKHRSTMTRPTPPSGQQPLPWRPRNGHGCGWQHPL